MLDYVHAEKPCPFDFDIAINDLLPFLPESAPFSNFENILIKSIVFILKFLHLPQRPPLRRIEQRLYVLHCGILESKVFEFMLFGKLIDLVLLFD